LQPPPPLTRLGLLELVAPMLLPAMSEVMERIGGGI
jgi:hypothetical protein